jgi:DNA-binding NarL/FixJ family response regulator
MPALLVEATEGRSTQTRRMLDDTITVMIVDTDPILHAGVERQLTAVDGVKILSRTCGQHPDVALLVADTIDAQVITWIRALRRRCLSRIVVVATANGQSAAGATEAGANGVMSRTLASGPRLAWAIQKVRHGETVVLIAPDERPEPTGPSDTDIAIERPGRLVSPRDREVLRLLAEGCDTGEIARALNFSEPTIKNVIQKLFDQLEAKNRPHAVALALRSGII